MTNYDELYEKMYEEIKEKGLDIEDCELDWYSANIELVLRDPESGADVIVPIDLSEYFGSVHDLPGIDENIEEYADMDELLDMRADNLASDYASEHEDEDEDEEEDE